MRFDDEWAVFDALQIRVDRLQPSFRRATRCVQNLIDDMTNNDGLQSNRTEVGKTQSARIAVILNFTNYFIFWTKEHHSLQDAKDLAGLYMEIQALRQFKPRTEYETHQNLQSQYLTQDTNATNALKYGLGVWYVPPPIVQHGPAYFSQEQPRPRKQEFEARSQWQKNKEPLGRKDWDA